MCCNRSLNNKINRLHEHYLRAGCSDKKLNSEELLGRDVSVSIHHQNIRFLAVEIFKVSQDRSPQIVKETFQFKTTVPFS